MILSNQLKTNIAYIACFLVSEAALIPGAAWATHKNNPNAMMLWFAAFAMPFGASAAWCVTSMFDTSANSANEHENLLTQSASCV